MGDFDSIKIGVCDIHFLPLSNFKETTLNGDVDPNSATIIVVNDLNKIEIGNYIVIDHHVKGKEEIFRVQNINVSTKALTINPRPVVSHTSGAQVKILENFGLTQGGVSIRYSSTWKEITADQYGTTPIDAALTGERIIARVPMLETNVTKLQYAITAGTLAGNKMMVGHRPGLRVQDKSTLYVLHPISSGVSVKDDIIIYRAAVTNTDIELPFKVDQERILEVEFVGYVDATKVDGSYLCQIGNNDMADIAIPILVSGSVEDLTPTKVDLTFSENLDTTNISGNYCFVILVDGAYAPLDPAVPPAITNNKLTLSLVNAVNHGQEVRVNYIPPIDNYLRDIAGNAVPGISNVLITNNVA